MVLKTVSHSISSHGKWYDLCQYQVHEVVLRNLTFYDFSSPFAKGTGISLHHLYLPYSGTIVGCSRDGESDPSQVGTMTVESVSHNIPWAPFKPMEQ